MSKAPKEMKEPKKIFLSEYTPPNYLVKKLDLFFDLHEEETRVVSRMRVIVNPDRLVSDQQAPLPPLILNGVGLELEGVKWEGRELLATEYQVGSETLTLPPLPFPPGSGERVEEGIELEIAVRIKPQENLSLEGLYKTGGIFCSQCEAEGFRRITYYPDRPDVMSLFRVSIEADRKKYPLLLSNGNAMERVDLGHGRHRVVWEDPFKKPSYLFALVAGDLGVLRDEYVTSSGRKVALEIYAAHGFQDRCRHAMESLKKAMRWDEERFGLEYDLNTYMVVAVDDFNSGAMENKGLNVFSSRYIYACPTTATDDDYADVESVVAHEYFHNWTGNRITLRDWFHLSLKEGLTVFRDQEFSADVSSRALVRIENVMYLRLFQFPEDAGPNAHPIRPESCYSVDNFYTTTIYDKGSEVIRMMQTLVGRPGFRKGMDLYFRRHDGQAVIIENFAAAIADANQQDWSQFRLWYSQTGTPRVRVEGVYDPHSKKYTLKLSQESNASHPLHIPLVFGLLIPQEGGKDGIEGLPTPVVPDLNSNPGILSRNSEGQDIIHLKEKVQILHFEGISSRPILSINRDFSAPIYLDQEVSEEDLVFLMMYDSDPFNRWEASQVLYQREFSTLIRDEEKGGQPSSSVTSSQGLSPALVRAFGWILKDESMDRGLKSLMMVLPDDKYLVQVEGKLSVPLLVEARDRVEKTFAQTHEGLLRAIYQGYHGKNRQSLDYADVAKRKLKNQALFFLARLPQYQEWIYDQSKRGPDQIMTDQRMGLRLLCRWGSPLRDQVIEEFCHQWKDDFNVMNSWFQAQADSRCSDVFDRVVGLWDHPLFNKKNPSRIFSLLRAFGVNLVGFHNPLTCDEAYSFMADRIIEIDKYNALTGARLASCFNIWGLLPQEQKNQVRRELERLLRGGLSKGTYEVVHKCLEGT